MGAAPASGVKPVPGKVTKRAHDKACNGCAQVGHYATVLVKDKVTGQLKVEVDCPKWDTLRTDKRNDLMKSAKAYLERSIKRAKAAKEDDPQDKAPKDSSKTKSVKDRTPK